MMTTGRQDGLDILPNYTFYQLDGVLQFNKLTPNFRNS